MNEQDVQTLLNMIRHGGSFVRLLAIAAQQADPHNLEEIKKAFPEYWTFYSEKSMEGKDFNDSMKKLQMF